jgi:hypothetical protein
VSPWPTPAAVERAEPSLASLLAQLDDVDAGVDGEEDADAARTLAAVACEHAPCGTTAGGVAPSVSTLFATDAVATEEPGPSRTSPAFRGTNGGRHYRGGAT